RGPARWTKPHPPEMPPRDCEIGGAHVQIRSDSSALGGRLVREPGTPQQDGHRATLLPAAGQRERRPPRARDDSSLPSTVAALRLHATIEKSCAITISCRYRSGRTRPQRPSPSLHRLPGSSPQLSRGILCFSPRLVTTPRDR